MHVTSPNSANGIHKTSSEFLLKPEFVFIVKCT